VSTPGQTVTVDAEWLLGRLEAIDHILVDIRRQAAGGLGRPGSPAGLNIHAITWKKKGSEPAYETDSWAWAFAYQEDGFLKDETRQLVEEINRYGKVEVDGYVITLSGRDKTLLSRKKLGSQRSSR